MGNDRLATKKLKVALTGNPNCGKTTLFNRLTGEKQAVGNYSGVTVEKVEGRLVQESVEFNIVDLPGIYSLTTFSKDEIVARDFLLREGPDIVVNVVDASNLERNLFLTLQLKELGLPLAVVFNMCDLAKSRGIVYDPEVLSSKLGVPFLEVVGTTGQGLDKLPSLILKTIRESSPQCVDRFIPYSEPVENEIERVCGALDEFARENGRRVEVAGRDFGVDWLIDGRVVDGDSNKSSASYEAALESPSVLARRRWIAVKLLEDDHFVAPNWKDEKIERVVGEGIERLSADSSVPIAAKFAAERYAAVRTICRECVRNEKKSRILLSDRADRILTHPFWGLIIFFLAMFLVFWLTFAVGNYPVGWLESLFDWLGNLCNRLWANSPDSLLRSMIVEGIIGGVGGVLTFFPNIFVLFAAISILEESGYMARGAFLTDRFLRRFGLAGKSFIPMLVGFGCSIPAVMATRIIEDRKARLSTIFVVPLMSCGARFPIYVLIIPAFFPNKWQAPVLWCVYFAGIVIAAVISSILSVTTFRKEHNPLLIELPAYHAPTMRTVGYRALERGWQYLRKAGTTILGVSLALWALSTFPRLPQSELASYEKTEKMIQARADKLGLNLDGSTNRSLDAEREAEAIALEDEWQKIQNEKSEAKLEYSIAGRIGKTLEPVISLAGFDWRIGTALVGALAAKEVFVAQLGVVFKVGNADETSKPLREMFRYNYSPLVGVCVIIFCLVGAPCLATLVVVAKEASLRWAFAQWFALTLTGFSLAVVAYQLGTWLKWGV